MLTVSKQPGADTYGITKQIQAAIAEVQPSLSAGIRIEALYAQEHFIDRAIENVMVALRDGGVLVVIILFLFLMNFRTTFISLLEGIKASLPAGYYFEFSGQFESQRKASQAILGLFALAFVGVFLTLYTMFRSINLSLQVMAAIPMAFIGLVAAIVINRQNLTIASMVGFISLGGIASRNGILLLQHYVHLVKYEGEAWSHEMIVRAGLERLALS